MSIKQTERYGLRLWINKEISPQLSVKDAAALIEHTEPGMRKMFYQNKRKLKALFIGYLALELEEAKKKAAQEAREKAEQEAGENAA